MTKQPSLKGYSVLIVDGASLAAADMFGRLSALGAKVHVVANAASAITLIRAKRLDVAMIGYPESTRALTRALAEWGVPYIVCNSAEKFGVAYETVISAPLAPAA